MWSHDDRVTLFGAVMGGSGWAEIEPIFQRLGASFSDCTSYDNEVIAAGAAGDLAYTVAYEHTTASIHARPPSAYTLRVTTIFHREDGAWKVVHRHADPSASPTAGDVLQQLASPPDVDRAVRAEVTSQRTGEKMTPRLITRTGVACLVVGPTALLAQALLTPVSAGGDAAAQVADAAGDLSAMRWALLLDAPLLLLVPAVLFVGAIAGTRQSRTATVGTGLAFMGTLAGMFLLANDILVYEAATSNDPGAIALVNDYQHNALFAAMLVVYIGGQVIGFGLLAIALWPTRAVPRWAAIALGAFPIVGFVLPPVGAALALAGLGAGALTLLRGATEPLPAESAAPVTPASI